MRHYDKVGVLAELLGAVRRHNINVETMQNTIFLGAEFGLCANPSRGPAQQRAGQRNPSAPRHHPRRRHRATRDMIQIDSHSSASRLPGLAQVPIVPRAVQRLRAGIPLVLRSDVAAEPSPDSEEVLLCDLRGQPIATALWVAQGPLAARLWSLSGESFSERDDRRAAQSGTGATATDQRRARCLPAGAMAKQTFAGPVCRLLCRCRGDSNCDPRDGSPQKRNRRSHSCSFCRLSGCSFAMTAVRATWNRCRVKGFLRGGPLRMARFHDAGSTMEADLLARSQDRQLS